MVFKCSYIRVRAQGSAYLAKPAEYAAAAKQTADAQSRENVEAVVDCLLSSRMTSFEECVTWARMRFQARRTRPSAAAAAAPTPD